MKYAAIPVKDGELNVLGEVHVLDDEDILRYYIDEDINYLMDCLRLREEISEIEKKVETFKSRYNDLKECKKHLYSVEDTDLPDFCNKIYKDNNYSRRILVTDN